MKNAEEFLIAMKSIAKYNEVLTLDDAIVFALGQVPMISYDRYFGDINGLGVYYGDSRESRWFPGMNVKDVSKILAEDMY
jgi:hypothetical protein